MRSRLHYSDYSVTFYAVSVFFSTTGCQASLGHGALNMHHSLRTCFGYNGKTAQIRSRKNWRKSSDTQSGFKPVLNAFTTSLQCYLLDRQANTHIQSHPNEKISQHLQGDFESAITEYGQCLHTLADSHCLMVCRAATCDHPHLLRHDAVRVHAASAQLYAHPGKFP